MQILVLRSGASETLHFRVTPYKPVAKPLTQASPPNRWCISTDSPGAHSVLFQPRTKVSVFLWFSSPSSAQPRSFLPHSLLHFNPGSPPRACLRQHAKVTAEFISLVHLDSLPFLQGCLLQALLGHSFPREPAAAAAMSHLPDREPHPLLVSGPWLGHLPSCSLSPSCAAVFCSRPSR